MRLRSILLALTNGKKRRDPRSGKSVQPADVEMTEHCARFEAMDQARSNAGATRAERKRADVPPSQAFGGGGALVGSPVVLIWSATARALDHFQAVLSRRARGAVIPPTPDLTPNSRSGRAMSERLIARIHVRSPSRPCLRQRFGWRPTYSKDGSGRVLGGLVPT